MPVGVRSRGVLPSLGKAQGRLSYGFLEHPILICRSYLFARHGIRARIGTGWRDGGGSSYTPSQPAPCLHAFS
jgi:hypothetical protein